MFVVSECVLCDGDFGGVLWGVNVCCVLESLVWVCGECVCAVCRNFWCGFVGRGFVLCVV